MLSNKMPNTILQKVHLVLSNNGHFKYDIFESWFYLIIWINLVMYYLHTKRKGSVNNYDPIEKFQN